MKIDYEGFRYWIRWQVLPCAIIIFASAVLPTAAIIRWGVRRTRKVDLWRPCWVNLHPFWLLAYRAVAACFLLFLLVQTIQLDGIFAFYFYTQWTFALVIVYFVIGTINSAQGCWSYSKRKCIKHEEHHKFLGTDTKENEDSKCSALPSIDDGQEGNFKYQKIQNHPEWDNVEETVGFWSLCMPIVYQTCAGAAMLTDVVFWCLLVPTVEFKMTMLIGSMHTLNVMFLLIDTAINRLAFPWSHFSYFVLWSSIYITFQWVLHACGFSWWPYPFLELSTPWAPLWYLGITLVHIPCYGMYALVVKLKVVIFAALFPHAFLRS